MRLVNTIALIFAFSPNWTGRISCFPWPVAPRMHLILFVVWTVMTHLKFRNTKSRRLPTGQLVDKLHKQDFTGPLSSHASRVLGPIGLDRVADILRHMKKCVCVLLAWVTCWLPSHPPVMGSALHKDFTLKNMITHDVVGCPNEPDSSLSHTSQSVSPVVQHFCFFLETCYNFATEKSFIARLDHPGLPAKPSIWNCGTVVGFLDALLCPSSAPSKHRESWKLW